MNLICTLKKPPIIFCLFSLFLLNNADGQVCSSPATIIYGFSSDGGIYPITTATATVGARINPAYTGNSASSSNAIGYNTSNGMFYYFKRNADQAPQEFMSYNPATNTHTILGSCPSTANIKTGCVNTTGSGYYCIDENAVMYFYRFSSGMWRQVANNYVDQWSANVTATLAAHSSGDIAMDGAGNLWFLCSNATTYGLYRINGALPTNNVGTLNVIQRIATTTPTPTGNTFAGIAFNPTGQIFLSQYGDNRFYRLNNNYSLTLMGTLSSAVGTDLTSCNYPMVALASKWINFSIEAKGNEQTQVSWTVVNENVKGYYIEFSTDAEKWNTIGFVESFGIESIQSTYSFISTATTSGRNYYRIRQVDLDGQYSYSEVKFTDIKINNQVCIGPNPTKGMILVKSSMTMSSRIYFFDVTGQLLKEAALNKGINSINIAHLPPGTYLVRVQAENGQTFHERIIKE